MLNAWDIKAPCYQISVQMSSASSNIVYIMALALRIFSSLPLIAYKSCNGKYTDNKERIISLNLGEKISARGKARTSVLLMCRSTDLNCHLQQNCVNYINISTTNISLTYTTEAGFCFNPNKLLRSGSIGGTALASGAMKFTIFS